MKKNDYISLINYGVQSPTCKKGLLELVDKYFELRSKETPKKVIELSRENHGYKHECPVCGQLVGTLVMENALGSTYRVSYIHQDEYCCSCGQKLDWGDADE